MKKPLQGMMLSFTDLWILTNIFMESFSSEHGGNFFKVLSRNTEDDIKKYIIPS